MVVCVHFAAFLLYLPPSPSTSVFPSDLSSGPWTDQFGNARVRVHLHAFDQFQLILGHSFNLAVAGDLLVRRRFHFVLGLSFAFGH